MRTLVALIVISLTLALPTCTVEDDRVQASFSLYYVNGLNEPISLRYKSNDRDTSVVILVQSDTFRVSVLCSGPGDAFLCTEHPITLAKKFGGVTSVEFSDGKVLVYEDSTCTQIGKTITVDPYTLFRVASGMECGYYYDKSLPHFDDLIYRIDSVDYAAAR